MIMTGDIDSWNLLFFVFKMKNKIIFVELDTWNWKGTGEICFWKKYEKFMKL